MTRCLIGWAVGVWLYLGIVAFLIARADRDHLKRVAMAQAEGAKTVLAVVALAALSSLGAVVFELSAAKGADARHAWPHIALALATVVGSWLMLPVLFGLNYASSYHADSGGTGLGFPAAETPFEPGYGDFFYVSFTIAVASQTSDVTVTTRPMRRLVLLQAVLSFIFNTMILAFCDQHGGEPVLTRAPPLARVTAQISSCDSPCRCGHDAGVDLQRAVDQPADRARIDQVLARQHARGQRVLGVVGQHRHDRLRDDRPVVEVGGDEVHRRAGHLAAGLDRAPVRVQAGERRQQRRMDVDEAALETRDEGRREDAHEAGQRDQVGREARRSLRRARHRRPRAIANARWSTTAVAMPRAAREREPGRLGPVADDRRDARVPALGGAGLRRSLPCWSRARRSGSRCSSCRAQCIGGRGATYNALPDTAARRTA